MSIDLQDRIQGYATWVEAGQEPVTLDEIRHRRDETAPLISPGSERRLGGPWQALVAAAVVSAIFGVFVWVFPSDGPASPAESLPPPWEQGTAYFTTTAMPDGFVLQDMRSDGINYLSYLRESGEPWLPTDGGFSIIGIGDRPFGVPEDPDGYLDATLDAVPGSIEVDLSGRRGVVFETEFSQGDVTAPLIWVLGVHDRGEVFEVAAVGMTREEVLDVADGVAPISVDEFVALGSELTWDVQIGTGHNDFVYSTPRRLTDLAEELTVALGMDLLYSRLAHAAQESTVVTTQDGEIVDTLGQAIRSASANHYVDVPGGDIGPALRAYPDVQLSPNQRRAAIDEYLDSIGGGPVLSREPYVIQGIQGPEPRFDPSGLGRELPLVPATSMEVVPISVFGSGSSDPLAATEDRPVVVIGSVEQPGSDAPVVTAVLWFTATDMTCVGAGAGEALGSGCGFDFYPGAGVRTESSMGTYNHIDYVVPLEVSVVQIVTSSENYWQRPIAGVGMVTFGDTVGRPSLLIGYDVDGNEIGSWPG